jgi:site-specific recombinase XerD
LSISSDPTQAREARRLAEVIRARRELQLVAEVQGMIDPVGSKSSLIGYAEATAKSMPKTSHLGKSMKYLRPFAGAIRLEAIDESFLERYRECLVKASGLAVASSVNYFQGLKTLLRKAVRDRLLTRNPGENVRGIRSPDSKRIALTAEEIARLAATDPGGKLGAEIRRAFLFSTQSGLRVSDLHALRWGDIERTPEPRLAMRQTKTEGMVFIPLNATAWKLVNDGAIHREDEAVFNIPVGSCSAVFKRWAKVASITKPLSWHIGRHSFTVALLESGAGIYEVSKLLGHRSIRQVETYARMTSAMARRAVDLLPALELAK